MFDRLTGVEGAMQATDEERRKLAERLSAEEAKLQEQAHLTRRLARKLHLLVQVKFNKCYPAIERNVQIKFFGKKKTVVKAAVCVACRSATVCKRL